MSDIIEVFTVQYQKRTDPPPGFNSAEIVTKQFKSIEEVIPYLQRTMAGYNYKWIQVKSISLDLAENKWHKSDIVFHVDLSINHDTKYHTPIMDQMYFDQYQ